MRVVSLLPAATEIVTALGGRGMLVGVSHECDYPPEVRSLPHVTRTRIDPAQSSGAIDRAVAEAKRTGAPSIEVDARLVAHLRPDVIIGQAQCEVCAVGEGELASLVATLLPTPWVVTLHAHTLEGVFQDIRKVGEALGLPCEATELIAGLRYRVRQLARRRVPERRSGDGGGGGGGSEAEPRPAGSEVRVLVIEWLDPPYVAGHWVPELVALAGGTDVGNVAGGPSRVRPWGELAALAPDLVIVALCGFDVPRAQQELQAVTDPDAQALFRRRVEFLDGNAYTSRPGPRLVDAAAFMSRWIVG